MEQTAIPPRRLLTLRAPPMKGRAVSLEGEDTKNLFLFFTYSYFCSFNFLVSSSFALINPLC